MIKDDKIKALKLARIQIEEGGIFICWALTSIANYNPELRRATLALKCYIAEQLAPCNSLGQWQAEHDLFTGAPKVSRLAWIDWMIKQLEEPK